MSIRRYEFNKQLISKKVQLFPDDICLDPYVAYHGTSCVFEDDIDSQGLRWASGLVSKSDLERICSIYEEMNWHGISTDGYAALKGFSLGYDLRDRNHKSIFLAESSYRASMYASVSWCGGETIRGVSISMTDLDRYLDDPIVRKDHLEYREHEYAQLKELNAFLPDVPKEVNLDWLSSEMARLAEIRNRVDALRATHNHGVVYAVKFDVAQLSNVIRSSSMGIEVKSITPSQLIAKVHVPSDWKFVFREDPHRLRANLAEIF